MNCIVYNRGRKEETHDVINCSRLRWVWDSSEKCECDVRISNKSVSKVKGEDMYVKKSSRVKTSLYAFISRFGSFLR